MNLSIPQGKKGGCARFKKVYSGTLTETTKSFKFTTFADGTPLRFTEIFIRGAATINLAKAQGLNVYYGWAGDGIYNAYKGIGFIPDFDRPSGTDISSLEYSMKAELLGTKIYDQYGYGTAKGVSKTEVRPSDTDIFTQLAIWSGGSGVWQPGSWFEVYARCENGDQEESGTPGTDGITPHIGSNGNWFIGETDTGVSAQGERGEKGDKGDKGDTGEAFTYSDFTAEQLAALKGDKGDTGATGESGADGADGKSAYQIALDNGFVGSQSEWLASLKGDKGDKGESGASASITANEILSKIISVDGENSGLDADLLDGHDSDYFATVDHNHNVATQSADGFMSSADKEKLDGISEGANNYTHPDTHPASMIEEDASHRFVSDTEKAAWNNKSNSDHNHDSEYLKLSGGTLIGNLILNGDPTSDDMAANKKYVDDAISLAIGAELGGIY